jgi:predicted RNA-binding protein YlxR (DUF448 family)
LADRPQRPQPQRTCVACRSTSGKRELLRVVRTPAGRVEVDPTGKRAGRGAYLCNRLECWQTALKKGRLDAALRVTLAPDDKLALTQFAAMNLPANPAQGNRASGQAGKEADGELAGVSGGASSER